MELTKKGDNPDDWIWKGRCSHCKAEFEEVRRNIPKITSDQREGDFAHVDCPECGREAPSAVVLYPPPKNT